MKRTIFLSLMALCAQFAHAGPAETRGVCEGRAPDTGAFERETACSALLADPGLPPRAVAMTLVYRAWARVLLNRRADAMTDYNRAAALDAGSHIVLNERALLNLREGRLDAALRDYQAALKLKPDEAFPRFGRGLVYLRKGDRKSADADFAAARIANPGIDAVFQRIGLSASK